MTVITGNIRDIGLQPLSGTLIATSVEFRSEGSILIAPESRSWPVTLGDVVVDLLPGPARITVAVGSHVRESWDVVVPESAIDLGTLVADSIEWAPPVVSIVGEHRRAAEAAAQRAESAADDVDAAISGAADQVVQAVEGDRILAEAARTGAEAARSDAALHRDTAMGYRDEAQTAQGAAAGSATAAASSASAAAGSASAASGSATDAAGSATTASAGAQIITNNLAAIEAAPGHAAAAQAARTGAETARDAASGSATAADGSATAAAGSASEAAGSATSAASSASAASSSATTAGNHAGTAATQAGIATNAKTTAVDAASAASGHADASAGSASAASGSAVTASTKAGEAATSASDAAAALAQVLVELANTQAYQDVLTAIGDMSSDWNADIAAALADLVGQAPETLDTIDEIATALGNDPNFFTTIMDAIGQKVSNNDPRLSDARTPTSHDHPMPQVTGLADALDGKSDVGHGHTWGQVSEKPGTFPSTIALVAGLQAALDGKAATGHTHTKAQVGLGNVDNTSDAAKPISTATQAALTPLQNRVGAAPATWRWNGTSLPTAASQVHAQARAGDFIVAPNLTADPGWHQITGV